MRFFRFFPSYQILPHRAIPKQPRPEHSPGGAAVCRSVFYDSACFVILFRFVFQWCLHLGTDLSQIGAGLLCTLQNRFHLRPLFLSQVILRQQQDALAGQQGETVASLQSLTQQLQTQQSVIDTIQNQLLVTVGENFRRIFQRLNALDGLGE